MARRTRESQRGSRVVSATASPASDFSPKPGRGMKFWKRKSKNNDNNNKGKDATSTPERIQINDKSQIAKQKSRGILSQASTVKVNNIHQEQQHTTNAIASNVTPTTPASIRELVAEQKYTKAHALMDDVSVDNSLTEKDEEVLLVQQTQQQQFTPSSSKNTKKMHHVCQSPYCSSCQPSSSAYNNNRSNVKTPLPHPPPPPKSPPPAPTKAKQPMYHQSPISASSLSSQSPSPSKWKHNQSTKRQMCIARLHELARKHNSAGVSALLPNEEQQQQQQQQKSTTNQAHNSNAQYSPRKSSKIKQVLGTSPPALKSKSKSPAAAAASPTTVLSFTSIKTGMKNIANTSMNSLFKCTTSLQDVECRTILKDGFSEFKDDFHFLAGTGVDEYDYYDDEEEEEEEEEEETTTTDFSRSLRSHNNEDGVNYGSAFTSNDNNNTTDSHSDTSDIDPNTILIDRSSLDMQNISGMSSTSPSMNPLTRHTPQPRRKMMMTEEESDFSVSNNQLQPHQMNQVGVRVNSNVSGGGGGDIPMKQNKSYIFSERDAANPTTRNRPWDERSASSRSESSLRLNENDFVSLKDVGKRANKSGLHYNNDGSVMHDEAEV